MSLFHLHNGPDFTSIGALVPAYGSHEAFEIGQSIKAEALKIAQYDCVKFRRHLTMFREWWKTLMYETQT